jgi:rhodanese-related sulfurtransferase
MKTISPNQLGTLLKENSLTELIDVRTPAEFGEVHVVNAVNIPLDSIDAKELAKMRDGKNEAPLYIICKSGARGEKACKKLMDAGIENVINVEGGTDACVAEGLSVNRGKKAMSLERQVRIAAGVLILTGITLGFQQHPGFFGLSAFVGVGLILAGITDWCGMGMLLAKMPWNQAPK